MKKQTSKSSKTPSVIKPKWSQIKLAENLFKQERVQIYTEYTKVYLDLLAKKNKAQNLGEKKKSKTSGSRH